MEAIVRNSMAVAHVCSDPIRQEIFQSCHEVTKLRRQLSDNLRSVQSTPGTQSVRDAFDATAELLCEEFRVLDRLVNGAVVQQVATVFVDPSTHIHRLIGAAVSPARTTLDPILELNEPIEAFKAHAARLSQVATSAATSSQDARKVRVIQSTAAELDKLTPQIVSAAVATRRNPDDAVAKDHLELLRREWASKVQLLTGSLDEITDKGHFMAASEASIREEMGRCRDAIKDGDTERLAVAAQTICGRARRIADVGRAEISNSDDPNFKARVQRATTRLEAAIPGMSSTSNRVIGNIRDPQAQQNFADAMRELLEGVREVRYSLDGDRAASEEPIVVRKKVIAGRESPAVRDAAVQMTAPQLLHGPKYMSTPSASDSRAEPYNPYKQMFATPSGRDETIQEKKSLLVGSAQSTAASVLEQLGKSATAHSSVLPSPTLPDFGYLGNANTAVMAETTANRLVDAAQSGDQDRVDAQCSAATYLGGNLIGLAEKAANSSTNREKIRLVHVTAAEIEKLVPQMTELAHAVCENPANEAAVERLNTLAHGWAEKVQVLAGALDSMVTPWSGPAVRLARVVQTGGSSLKLDKEAESMRAFSRRMGKLAQAAIAAADAEDNAEITSGGGGGGGMASSAMAATRDPAAAKRVSLVDSLSRDVEKMTPKVIAAAQRVATNPGDKAAIEQFEMLRREWASKVKTLAVAVDDITIGTSSPAEALTQAAERNERSAIKDQGDALRQYASALKDVADCASAGCGDPEKVQAVKVTSGQVEKLTVQLVDAAGDMVETATCDDGSAEKRGLRLDATEKMELLKREWASKVHLLTAVIDDLTSEVSSPVDRLAGSALAVSRSGGIQKDRQLASFREQASSLRARVARVEERCQAAVRNSVERAKAQKVRNCTDFMAKLTPEVISAARELSENPDQVTVEHFQLLRRQWAGRAQLLVTTLDEIADADMTAVSAAVQDLLSPSLAGAGGAGATPSSLASFESFSSSYRPFQQSSLLRSGRTRSEEQLSSMSSSETQRKRASTGDDMISLGSSLSGGGGVGGAGGSKKSSSFLSSAAAQPTPPSARSAQRRRRPLSAVEPSVTTATEMTRSEEELSADISYRSIQEAARLLQEEVNEFEVEGNELIMKANEMAEQMIQMAAYTRGKGELQSKAEMITMAKAIAANGNVMVRFAKGVAERCVDKRMKKDLEYYAEVIPTISQQLRIISSVKAATPRDPSANVMLVKNAQNLMHAVTKTLHAAESACMKGLQDLGADDAATEVAMQWKRKVYKQRTLEAFTAPMGSRGLRKLSRYVAPPLAQGPN
ncbi:uncharacterized protein [Oscarella lobularis]|uniref:uncharacterized protein n=1 Tax=Oscarella lobularis TaxID=121494 RepID=UPI0033143CCC